SRPPEGLCSSHRLLRSDAPHCANNAHGRRRRVVPSPRNPVRHDHCTGARPERWVSMRRHLLVLLAVLGSPLAAAAEEIPPAATGGSTGAIDAFYAAFPGANPGFVATYLAWNTQTFGAFYAPVASDTVGIGSEHVGPATFGDPNGLNGWIFMNSVQMYDLFGGP